VGGDLFGSNAVRLDRGAETRAANAVLIDLNQVATLTETLTVMARARETGYRTVVSDRAGLAGDPFAGELAVGSASGQVDAGPLAGPTGLATRNQLLRIEEELGVEAYAGSTALEPPVA